MIFTEVGKNNYRPNLKGFEVDPCGGCSKDCSGCTWQEIFNMAKIGYDTTLETQKSIDEKTLELIKKFNGESCKGYTVDELMTHLLENYKNFHVDYDYSYGKYLTPVRVNTVFVKHNPYEDFYILYSERSVSYFIDSSSISREE